MFTRKIHRRSNNWVLAITNKRKTKKKKTHEKCCHCIFNRNITVTKRAYFPTSFTEHYSSTLKYVALVSLPPSHVAHEICCCYYRLQEITNLGIYVGSSDTKYVKNFAKIGELVPNFKWKRQRHKQMQYGSPENCFLSCTRKSMIKLRRIMWEKKTMK